MSLIEKRVVSIGLVKSGLVSAISSAGISVPRRRFFRRNEGTTDFVSIPTATLSTDFRVRFDAVRYGGIPTQNELILSNATNTDSFVYYPSGNDTEIFIKITKTDETNDFTLRLPRNGLVAEYTFSKVGSLFTFSDNLGNTVNVTITNAKPLVIERIGQGVSMAFSNLEVDDNGTQIRRYAVGDNSDTVVDSVSGQDGTVINGNTDDWGLFEEIIGGWKGQGLAVPPWDSVDQELISA